MSGTTEQLAAERWVEYFDSIAGRIEGRLATIEIMSEELGDQTDVERLPLQAVGYDPKDNVLEIAVGGRGTRYPVVLRHFISDPQAISIQQSEPSAPSAILVTDTDGTRTLLKLFEPAALGT
jgi:hypothetical protein